MLSLQLPLQRVVRSSQPNTRGGGRGEPLKLHPAIYRGKVGVYKDGGDGGNSDGADGGRRAIAN